MWENIGKRQSGSGIKLYMMDDLSIAQVEAWYFGYYRASRSYNLHVLYIFYIANKVPIKIPTSFLKLETDIIWVKDGHEKEYFTYDCELQSQISEHLK